LPFRPTVAFTPRRYLKSRSLKSLVIDYSTVNTPLHEAWSSLQRTWCGPVECWLPTLIASWWVPPWLASQHEPRDYSDKNSCRSPGIKLTDLLHGDQQSIVRLRTNNQMFQVGMLT
jgi:hypothetical protein